MLTLPVRVVVAVFAAIVIATVPFPEPGLPLFTTIHVAKLVADQLQPLAAVTPTLAVSPTAAAVFVAGLIAYEHPDVPCWVTVKLWPAMLALPVREAVPVLAAMLMNTVPLPVPLAPLVIAIHGVLLAALHTHPVAAVTLTLVLCPLAVALVLAGVIP
jgi:hypothetical protein